ncbi:MAG TPA: AAA family ATPase, partial [Gemmatimonadales bacterium]|nr:AAA family ATPase [Gemmatimonadales bacterium]
TFVGREAEYSALYERWEQTRHGNGTGVLVLGDSGVGKTTVMERLVTAAGLEGAVSARVQCYEAERDIPYSAISTLVRGLATKPGASATPPEWLAELALTVPSVGEAFKALPIPPASEGEAARLRLTEAVIQLVMAVADENPLIIVIDDVHLADDVSIAVLHLMMRRIDRCGIMLLLAAQRNGLTSRPHSSRLLDAQEELGFRIVEIPLLSSEEVQVVLSSLAARTNAHPTGALLRALVGASAGNPMAAEMLFDDWIRHGEACLALSVKAMTEHPHDESAQDILFGQILERVAHGLSESARAVLSLAALLGDRMNDLTMYELVDLSLAQTLAGMSELTTRRIFRDGGRELEFRNELLRGHAYMAVPSPMRRALHGMIADRLISAASRGEMVSGLALAWHSYRAGRTAEAEPHLLVGAREAIEKGAPFEAELALSSALPHLRGEIELQARLILSAALQEQGRWSESLSVIASDSEWPAHLQGKERSLVLNARAMLSQDPETSAQMLDQIAERMENESESGVLLLYARAAAHLAFYLGTRAISEKIVDRLARLDLAQMPAQVRAGFNYSLATLAWSTRQLARFPN